MKKIYVNNYNRTSSKEKITMAILTGICIFAALITFFVVSLTKKWNNRDDAGVLNNNSDNVYKVEADIEDDTAEENYETMEEKPTFSEEGVVNANAENTIEVSTEIPSENNSEDGYCVPCEGDILKEFSPEIPIYSKTLEDWRTHNGIDIYAPLGAEVYSVANGVVLDVTNDLRYGYTVVIDHGNGIKSVYSNLDSGVAVKKGDNIKKGNIIAKVGDSALLETVEETHLHFEMISENGYLNPLDYVQLR